MNTETEYTLCSENYFVPFGQCVPGPAFRHVFGNGTPLQREIQDCPNCPTMIVVQGGTFWMGKTTLKALPTSSSGHLGDFAIGKFEVTQHQWTWLTDKQPNWRINACGPNCPISVINWYQATEYAENSAINGHHYRLPTEAEWEYARRSGGKDETRCGGETR